ncbi:unnamed protein product, partial [Nesidiocoris tenuis]
QQYDVIPTTCFIIVCGLFIANVGWKVNLMGESEADYLDNYKASDISSNSMTSKTWRRISRRVMGMEVIHAKVLSLLSDPVAVVE